MDSCFIDITIEFLAVAFHSILYYASVYPKSIFETRKKYSIVVYRSIHPEVNQYIDLCLKTIAENLKSGQLKRLEFAITDSEYKPLLKFVFDFDSLPTVIHKFNELPDDTSFTIFIHTNESTAVSMAANPDLENFPLIEIEEKFEESNKILPLRRFLVRDCYIDSYVEVINQL